MSDSHEVRLQAYASLVSARNMTADCAQETFRLLDLPPEIWSRICEFAVTDAAPIVLEYAFDDLGFCDAVAQPTITGVCRALRTEGLKLFYGGNAFIVKDNTTVVPILSRWLRAIGEHNRQSLADLRIISDYSDVQEYYDPRLQVGGCVLREVATEPFDVELPFTHRLSFVDPKRCAWGR